MMHFVSLMQLFFYPILTCFISCKYEAYFYPSTICLVISIKAMTLAVMNESLAIALMKRLKKFWTPTGFEPVTSRRSNQLSYEATDDGTWSFVGKNNEWSWISGRNDIYEMTPANMNCRHEIEWSYDPRSYNILQKCREAKEFSASPHNCYNCVHNCEDHSFTWFHIWFISYTSFRLYVNLLLKMFKLETARNTVETLEKKKNLTSFCSV